MKILSFLVAIAALMFVLPADAATVERIRSETHSRDVRVLTPGTAATMDYREDRINVDVNDRGAITGLRCG